MKIQLIDRNKVMCNLWKYFFNDIPDVVVHHGDFFDLSTDCVVSPANSFGFMDGGLDLVISLQLGWQVQEKLQKQIQEKYNGELLVGQAELVETDYKDIPFCISAPTMRVPMILEGTPNVYLASRAVFLLLKKEDRLISTMILVGDRDIMLYTKNGLGVRFSSNDIRETNRMSCGTAAINLEDGARRASTGGAIRTRP